MAVKKDHYDQVGSSMASGLSTGAGVGFAIGGPPGALVGAGLGVLFGGIFGQKKQEAADKVTGQGYAEKYQTYTNSANQLEADNDINKINITNAERGITAYDQTLADWDSTQKLQEDQTYAEANNQYSQLMSNYAGASASASAKGQLGGSSAIIASSAKESVVDFAGSDMTLNKTGGGTFSKIWDRTQQEFRDNKASTLLGKQDLYSSIDNYKASIKTNNKTISSYKKTANDYKNKAEEYGVKVN